MAQVGYYLVPALWYSRDCVLRLWVASLVTLSLVRIPLAALLLGEIAGGAMASQRPRSARYVRYHVIAFEDFSEPS
jgi:hypothetical protein